MLEIKPIFHALCRSKVGAILLLIQIAITTAIVSNAAFIIQDRVSYLSQETGYPEEDIFVFNVMMFGKDVSPSQQYELDETMLRQIPGVVDAAYSSNTPLSGSGSSSDFSLKPAPEESKSVRTSYMFIDEHGINTYGVKLIAGRNYTEDEVIVTDNYDELSKVTVVTKALVDELFPDGNGLGQTVYFGDIPMKIIGVIDLMKGPWLKDSRPDNVALLPFIKPGTNARFVVRTEPGQRQSVMNRVEEAMLKNYNKRVISRIRGLDDDKEQYMAEDTLMMRMLVVLIAILVLVTALGIFGLTLFNISKRTKQIGTRRALGARKSAIINYFLVENAMICVVGLVIGVIAAIYLGQVLMQHFSIAQLDISYVLVTALAVFIMSLLAVLAPAKRAANISPSIATRTI
ncbi:FtsX-like permease family protein [Pseudoalteromonas shioyasakiensis]|uniref:ABC transporter permease n=1 Tax=Pseudoalteromonas TaxID=53246 RepID=UPI000C95F2A6|nr:MULTISPECIES: FtsX-like permease family protein [Pseudoalteromonas]MAD02266.1 cell division protein FtsX [Pseudoalteromonas sp.]MCG9709325.1 FtsX-like permease family protein [Pseudoalteromonas sp. Isolate3]MCQ8882653.1 FtsX-like permease family protein [Pseudoalteromonas shioyasakiensis]QLE09657.1 FtsX-like permease family protein [Pseudoalteromonas shioyasakiensis]RZD22559.1 FtsX-like permease family protein [Pseudoalteromonas sp. MEBiC 03485]|tara:strand:- start:21872 stop:23077 length:1206 start_codon:yes stop_codon:yes gene_type:complete